MKYLAALNDFNWFFYGSSSLKIKRETANNNATPSPIEMAENETAALADSESKPKFTFKKFKRKQCVRKQKSDSG